MTGRTEPVEPARIVIVNGDDFGQSPGVNRGFIKAHEHGILTSASLMVRWPAAREAAAYAREHSRLGVGLHFDLGEWARRNGRWTRLYQVVSLDDLDAVRQELMRQLETFHELVGRGPTHIDSHQHVHREDGIREIVIEAARTLRVPVREMCPSIEYFGDFYGQTGHGDPLPDRVSAEWLIQAIEALPSGTTEIGCHPGDGDDVDSMYVTERTLEVVALCDPRVRECLERRGIELRTFEGLSGNDLEERTDRCEAST